MQKALPALLLLSLALPAEAAIYKYVDAEGNVTFTDRYRPGAVKLVDDGNHTVAPSARRRGGQTSASPANFPRVDRQTQSRRDDVRRSLLLDERKSEENALAAVLSALAGGKPRSPADQAKLQENRRLHEKNIEMLDKELARIK